MYFCCCIDLRRIKLNTYYVILSCSWRTKPSRSPGLAHATHYRLALNSHLCVLVFARNSRLISFDSAYFLLTSLHVTTVSQKLSQRPWRAYNTGHFVLFTHQPSTCHAIFALTVTVPKLPSLHNRREHINRQFFTSISNSRISSLLPIPRNHDVTSRLRAASLYPRPVTCTRRYTSFINYSLLHYQ